MFVLVGVVGTQSAVAEDAKRGARIEQAWSDWAEAGGTQRTTLAVLRNGTLVGSFGIGLAPDTAMPLASLSKVVTAACLEAELESDDISMETTLGDLGELPWVPDHAEELSVAELLTHTSGLGPDLTQGDAQLRGQKSPMIETVARRALARDPQAGVVGKFAYNNENYAVLGAIVEAVSGSSYESACRQAVLDPLGIQSANIEGEWAAHGPWGGWSMSAPDFAAFAWATFGPNSAIGANPADWPSADAGGDASYGMGVLWREIRGRKLFWSSGILCWNSAGDGGYFASYGGEWLVVALYNDCLDGTNRLRALDEALFKAAVL